MGTVTNLATTGNYATETNGLKVSFNFEIDNKTSKLTKISNGSVGEGATALATFYTDKYGPAEAGERVQMSLQKGREVELATAIANAIADLESKIAKGESL